MKSAIIITPIFIIFILSINGCSVVGNSIGSQIDNSNSKVMLPSHHSISSLTVGSDLDIYLYNKSIISGKFISSDSLKTINVEVGTKTLKIPLNDIRLIKKTSSFDGRIIGGVAGLLLDIIILRFIISGMTFGPFL